MTRGIAHLLRANVDIVAIAMIAVTFTANMGFARPRMSLIYASDRTAYELDERAQRVWDRLERKMRSFEERFNRAAVPQVRSASCQAPEDGD